VNSDAAGGPPACLQTDKVQAVHRISVPGADCSLPGCVSGICARLSEGDESARCSLAADAGRLPPQSLPPPEAIRLGAPCTKAFATAEGESCNSEMSHDVAVWDCRFNVTARNFHQ